MTSRIPESSDPFEDEGIPVQGDDEPLTRATGDSGQGMEPPHDFPLAVEEWGTTSLEQSHGESLSQRVTREEPDVLAAADRPANDLDAASEPFSLEREGRVGRLVAPDETGIVDTEADETARDAGTDLGGFTAEEAAMHAEPER